MSDSAPAAGEAQSKQPGLVRRRLSVVRWIASIVLLAIAPKCALCVAGYLGIAAGLGVTGGELCGGSTDSFGFWTWTAGCVLIAMVLGLSGALFIRRLFALGRAMVSERKRVIR